MSISGYSYKDVEARLKAFADGHYVIRRYSVGEATDFDASDGTWPLMHVVHPAITPDAGQVTYNFEVVFADLPRDFNDKTGNQVEAISDLIRLALDLLSEIKNGSVLFGEDALVTSSNIDTGAVQSFNSVCIARLTFTLVLPWDWNACDIPADYAPAGSSTSLFPIDGGCCDVEYYISKNNQPGNNFALGDVIRVSGTNTFAKARANTLANSYAVGVVTALGGDAYNYKMGGIVTEGVPNHPAGTIMYLSDSVAGAMTTMPPAIVRPVMVIVEPAARAILMLSLVNPGTGGIEGVTGNIVDNTDPQNPVVDQVQANWNESDNTDPSFIQNKPAIPTGTVEGVTGDSVDNTDSANPVVNAWPLAGTGTDLATGTIEVDGSIVDIDLIKQFSSSLGGTGYVSVFIGDGDIGLVRNDGSGNSTSFTVKGGFASFVSDLAGAIRYGNDYSANFQPFSLIDLQTLKKRFWTKAGAPTTTDDDNAGFIVGSLIWDATNSILYRATSVTTGAAAWTVAIVTGSGTVNSGTANRLTYYAATGTAVSELAAITAARALKSDANGLPVAFDTATEPSLTELSYVKGVTSAIQTQLNTQAARRSVSSMGNNWNVTTVPASSTRFMASHDGVIDAAATLVTQRERVVAVAGTISQLYVTTFNSQPATGSLVYTFMLNGVAQSVTVTVPASGAAGTRSDLTNSFNVVAGDRVCIRVQNNATGTSAQQLGCQWRLASDLI